MQKNFTYSGVLQRGKMPKWLLALFFLGFGFPGFSQQINDSLFNFRQSWSFRQATIKKADYYLMNPQAYNATLMHSRTLFNFKNRIVGAGLGSEVVFNNNSPYVPGQQAFHIVQGMPIYPQYIPVAVRPGVSIFNKSTNSATLFQMGNLMEGRQGVTGGQIQVGKMWRIM